MKSQGRLSFKTWTYSGVPHGSQRLDYNSGPFCYELSFADSLSYHLTYWNGGVSFQWLRQATLHRLVRAFRFSFDLFGAARLHDAC
jgi:hypothetical protein